MTKFYTRSKGKPMSNLHIFGSLAAAGGGGGGSPATDFIVSVAPGTVGSDLDGFPLMVDFNDMPVAFWLGVRDDGGNVRAKKMADSIPAVSLSTSSNGWGGYTGRTTIEAAQISAINGKVRIRFRAVAGSDVHVDKVFIGHADSAGSYAFDAAPTALTFSGGAAFVLPATEDVYSDWVDFTYDGTSDLVVSFEVAAGSDQNLAGEVFATGFTTYSKAGADAETVAATGYTEGTRDRVAIDSLETLSDTPIDVTYMNTGTGRGRAFIRTDLKAGRNSTVFLSLIDAGTGAVAATDPLGRNAVWSDYEVVWQFPETVNRTGNAYTQSEGSEPHTLWQRVQYHEFAGNPHQGIAVDDSGNVVTLDTNYLRRYAAADLNTLLASNSDPSGDVQTATGGATTHMCDGAIIGGELWSICNNYPALSPSQEHLTVFNLSDLTLNRTYDISGDAGEQISSLCYNPSDGLIYACNYETGSQLHVFNTSGVYQSSISLSTTIAKAQGIEYVNGKLYVSQEASGNPVWEVELDGTVNGVIYNRPTSGINEGISYDGTSLWVLDGDGDLVRLNKVPSREDWIKFHFDSTYATLPLTQTWTMAASVYWTVPDGDLQQGFLATNETGTASNTHEGLLYDEGPDVFGCWNVSDGWMHSSLNPAGYDVFRVAESKAGTGPRYLYVDGAQEASDLTTTAKPSGAEGVDDMDFIVNALNRANRSDGEGYYQNVWLRAEAMSADWMAADHANFANPSGFYTITAA